MRLKRTATRPRPFTFPGRVASDTYPVAVLPAPAPNSGALTQDYKKTEMWLILPKDFRPPERYAQWATSTVMRDAYFTFAQYTALISIGLWVLALIVRLGELFGAR